jgi:F-type H+-transporting ATPase subunit b
MEGHAAEEEGGHHGAPVKLFGITLDNVGKFAVQVVNFAIFFAILYFILKGALSSAFKARAKELEDQLAQAEKDKAEGEAQLKELEAKMAGMQTELAGIMAKAETDAETEKQRILDAARTEASHILAQTQAEIEFLKRLAEKELRALVAELAIEGAARRLETRVQGATAERVLDQAIEVVGGAK